MIFVDFYIFLGFLIIVSDFEDELAEGIGARFGELVSLIDYAEDGLDSRLVRDSFPDPRGLAGVSVEMSSPKSATKNRLFQGNSGFAQENQENPFEGVPIKPGITIESKKSKNSTNPFSG